MRIACAFALLALLPASSPGEDAPAQEQITVALKPTTTEALLGYGTPRPMAVEETVPRFLAEIPRFRAKDPFFVRVALGETGAIPFYAALDRSEGATHHDLLYLDRNRDLDLTNDGPPLQGRVHHVGATTRKLVEFARFDLPLPYTIEGEAVREPYRCALFYEGDGESPPTTVLVERDGWREGTLSLDGVETILVMVDDDSDGQFATGDSWALGPAEKGSGPLVDGTRTRSAAYPCWFAAGAKTAEIVSVDRAGRSVTLRLAAAKESEQEYFVRMLSRRQTPEERELEIDPLRPKAAAGQSVNWLVGKELKYGIEIAAKVGKPALVEFTAPDCVWCARMAQHTFADREVVELARRFVCIKIAYVAGSIEATKYGVQGTPTYLALDATGKELARQSGFANPTRFAPWLKGALP